MTAIAFDQYQQFLTNCFTIVAVWGGIYLLAEYCYFAITPATPTPEQPDESDILHEALQELSADERYQRYKAIMAEHDDDFELRDEAEGHMQSGPEIILDLLDEVKAALHNMSDVTTEEYTAIAESIDAVKRAAMY